MLYPPLGYKRAVLVAEVLEGVAGLAIVVIILYDVFISVVVPRRAPNLGRSLRVTSMLIPRLWRAWREFGLRLETAERREALLGTFGSFAVIVLLIAWVSCLIFGYGLILFALRTQLR